MKGGEKFDQPPVALLGGRLEKSLCLESENQ
jgi:hypothetical protein